MAGKCRKGWQLPRSPHLAQPRSPTSFYTFFMYKSSEKLQCWREAQPTPHTAPVTELGLGSPGLTPVMVLEEFQILQPLLQ